MSAVDIFFNQLVPLCSNASEQVDISILHNINVLSPTKGMLTYSAVGETLSGIEEVVIKNFASNFSSESHFDTSAILAMNKVLQQQSDSNEAKARKMLMLHASKAAAEPEFVANLFERCAKMTVSRTEIEQLAEWKSIAINIVNNKKVIDIIDSAIEKYGVIVDKSFKTDVVELVWVSYSSVKLRGFSGINTVYINEKNFLLTKHCYEGEIDDKKLDLVMQVDVINVFIHELAHVKLRQCTNDVNSSASILAKNNNLGSRYLDFGRYVEEEVFGAAVDWAESVNGIEVDYLEQIVTSVKRNEAIPRLTKQSRIIVRDPPVLMALDYQTSKTFF